MKNYTVKIFDLDGVTLLRTLNPNEIMGGFSWSEQLNGGQGEFVLRLKLGFSSTAVAHSQIVRVYSQDSTYSPGTQRLLYTGIISILRRVSDMDGEYIEMRCLGISAILAWVFYASPSGNYNFTKNEAQDDIVMNLLDEFEVNYPNIISYTAGTSIEALGSTAHLDFYYESMLSALKKIIDTVDWYWRVDREGVFQFHPRSGGANPVTHILTISKDIELLDVEEDTEGIVNEYFVKYSGGAIETASDATSISTYWLRQFYEDRSSSVNGVWTAGDMASTHIAQNKDTKKRIRIVVNNKYDIDSIQAGHYVTVRNIDYSISFLQIVKLEYNMDRVTLELEQFRSFAQEILW